MPPRSTSASLAFRNGRIALVCAVVFAAMVGAAFAAVPLYRAFCQATGFAGAGRVVKVSPGVVSNETVRVRFDTNVRGLSWSFAPDQAGQTVKLGETKLAFFRATNTGPEPLTGRASYNILPESAGPYFSKLECFCFKNQTIQPGQTVEFPVAYYVDPGYAKDPDANLRGGITLSYTFFPATPTAQQASTASAPAVKPASPLGSGARARL